MKTRKATARVLAVLLALALIAGIVLQAAAVETYTVTIQNAGSKSTATVTEGEGTTYGDILDDVEGMHWCLDGSYAALDLTAEITGDVTVRARNCTYVDHVCVYCGAIESGYSCQVTINDQGNVTYKDVAYGTTYGDVLYDVDGMHWCFKESSALVDLTDTITGDVSVRTRNCTADEAAKENEVAATCTTDGSYDSVVYCTVCKAEISRETITVAATGHSYDGGEVTTAATCTEDGVKTFTCANCGETYTEAIPATGHSAEKVEAVAATETTDGNIAYWICKDCGKYFSDEALTVEIELTDTVVPATGTTASAANATSLKTAYDDALKLDKSSYTADSWAVLEKAVEAAKTVLADENATQEEIDAALAALDTAVKGLAAASTSTNNSTSTNTSTGSSSSVKTADQALLLPALAVLCASGIALLFLAICRKHRYVGKREG